MTASMGFPLPWSCMHVEEQPRRPRIDRSMISGPSNFQHTGHIGSANDPSQLSAIRTQMSSKGGAAEQSQGNAPMSTLSLEDAKKKFGGQQSEEANAGGQAQAAQSSSSSSSNNNNNNNMITDSAASSDAS